MNEAFQFGKIVNRENFTNRKEEIKRLHQNFSNRIHTILISPRRWGKSSLVHIAGDEFIANHKNYRICHLDLFEIRTEKDFYEKLSKVILKATHSKFDEVLKSVGKFLSKISPKIRLDMQQDIKFDMMLDINKEPDAIEEILELPEKIAKEKNIHIIICIDEFQNITELPDHLKIQKLLRSVWQKQQSTTYCLYGSKQHMLSDLFNKKTMPFYRFGDLFYIDKINTAEWVSYICKQFKKSGKHIDKALATTIAHTMDNHSYYVQQLSYFVWLQTDKIADETAFNRGKNQLMQSNTILFQKDFESLSRTQINFLKMLLDGIEDGFTKAENLSKYELGTSANIAKIIPQLEKKEIIERFGKKLSFSDPAFALWLKDLLND